MTTTASAPRTSKIRVPHFVRGELIWGEDSEYLSRDFGVPFVTPRLEYNGLFAPRSEVGPAFDVPVAEIIDTLTAGPVAPPAALSPAPAADAPAALSAAALSPPPHAARKPSESSAVAPRIDRRACIVPSPVEVSASSTSVMRT